MRNNKLRHVAIIPDGNRRWARKNNMSIRDGYTRGVKKFREIMEQAFECAVPYATFWAASEDNLQKRSRVEIAHLVHLLKQELADPRLPNTMRKHKAKLRFLGRWREILNNEELANTIQKNEDATRHFADRSVTILFGYDGKREMLEAIQNIKRNRSDGINHDAVVRSLWTGGLPPVDLVIRTGEEEPRVSHWSAGFMMWQTADSIFYTTKTLWPDFSRKEFSRALENCTRRGRRFGA